MKKRFYIGLGYYKNNNKSIVMDHFVFYFENKYFDRVGFAFNDIKSYTKETHLRAVLTFDCPFQILT